MDKRFLQDFTDLQEHELWSRPHRKWSSQMGSGQDGQVLWKLSTGSFGRREPPSSPPCEEPCEERESFIPPVRNVIISITDEMLPRADFYAFFFPLILWSDNSAASSLCIYFFSFTVLFLPSQRHCDCRLLSCYIWSRFFSVCHLAFRYVFLFFWPRTAVDPNLIHSQ